MWVSRSFQVVGDHGKHHAFTHSMVTDWLNEVNAESFVVMWVRGSCIIYARITVAHSDENRD